MVNYMNKKLFVHIALGAFLVLLALFFGSNGSARVVWNISEGGTLLLPLIVVSALVDSINPCAFSILLLTIAFLFSIGKLRSGILKIGGMYVFGIFVVYLLIGLGILQVLHLFGTPHMMAKIGAILLVVLGGINLINGIFPKFPIKLKIPAIAHRKIGTLMEYVSLPAAFALGVLVGLCEFPCTGGPYLAALGLLHDKTTAVEGFGYLFLYNLIFITPLAVILFISSHRSLIEKVEYWKREHNHAMRLWGGIITVLLGVTIFFF